MRNWPPLARGEPDQGRPRMSAYRARPVGRDVGAALLRDPATEAHEGGVRADLARDERLALAEGRGSLGQAGGNERQDFAEKLQIGGGVHPQQYDVVAL